MFDALSSGVAHFYFYQSVIVVAMIGLYVVIATGHLLKKIIGLGVFQGAVFTHLILSAYVHGGGPPILPSEEAVVNPLPHVLVLTAIVVAIATAALAFALVVRVYEAIGVINEDEIELGSE